MHQNTEALIGHTTINERRLEVHVVPHPGERRGWDIVLRLDGGYGEKQALKQAEHLLAMLQRKFIPGTTIGRAPSDDDHVFIVAAPDRPPRLRAVPPPAS